MRKRYVVISVLCVAVCLFMTAADVSARSLTRSDFRQIARTGFEAWGGDSANSYSWGVGWFNNDLYVGTVRHHLWSLGVGLSTMFPIGGVDLADPPSVTTWGDPAYADEMAGQIWRFRDNTWEMVHKSGTFILPVQIQIPIPGTDPVQFFTIPAGTYPIAYGYRTVGEFDGYLYACGVGTWIPPMPKSSVVRSASGDAGSWDDVTGILAGTINVRGLVEWNGKLYTAASLPGLLPGVGGQAVVYRFTGVGPGFWEQVSLPSFGPGENNAEIYYLTVFNNHLYASTVNLVTGFEVWKTNGEEDLDNPGLLKWTRVINHGFGDTWNQFGMTMQAFGNYLYIGTAVGAGYVQKDGAPVGSRPIEIIRADKDDNAQLIVGSRFAYDPIDGGPTRRRPLSGWPAGFGNPFNVYAWHMEVFQGWLYLGTFDMTSVIVQAVQQDPSLLGTLLEMFTDGFSATDLRFTFPTSIINSLLRGRFSQAVLSLMNRNFGGGDIWKTRDGIHWIPVTLNGLGNPNNYGIRRLVPYNDQVLAVGTANPFTGKPGGGCEVWLAGKIPQSGNSYFDRRR